MPIVYVPTWLESTNTVMPCDDNLAAYVDLIENYGTFIIKMFSFICQIMQFLLCSLLNNYFISCPVFTADRGFI
jgi:hypothetical protein